MGNPATPAKPPRIPVAIFLHSDGFVQAYADQNVDVKFVIVPRVDNPENESLAIDLAELQAGKKFKNVLFPQNLRASEMFRTISLLDLLQRSADMELLRAVEVFDEKEKETAKAKSPKKESLKWIV